MIVVISHDGLDTSTEFVLDWIESFGHHCLRINGEDFNGSSPFSLALGDKASDFSIVVGDLKLTSKDIQAVWFRRWHTLSNFGIGTTIENEIIARGVEAHLRGEMKEVLNVLRLSLQEDLPWLGHPGKANVSKIYVLDCARRAGLFIPITLVTNNRTDVESFIAKVGPVIVKPLGNAHHFSFHGEDYVTYTAELKDNTVAQLPAFFFPSLVQKKLEKKFEIRSFYLRGEFYSMAIFSQSDAKTSTDFRNYNYEKPNRCVPYVLSDATRSRLGRLMVHLELDTGSIDLIRTTDGRDVFLEVNPVGQFGMVSYPCNYNLEKKIAKVLVEDAQG